MPRQTVLLTVACLSASVVAAVSPTQEQASAYDRRGLSLAQSGHLPAAIDQFQQALRLEPTYVEARYHLGLAYDQSRQTDDAMDAFEEVLRLQPNYVEARYMFADCCRKRGDFAGELNILAQVVARAPQFGEAHYNYGLALKSRDKPQAAIEQLRAAVKLSPDNPKYLVALGVGLSDMDRDESVAVLRRAVEEGASSADAHYNLGLALANSGDDMGAERELHGALAMNPKHALALRALGVTLMHEGKLAQAVSVLARALEAAPRDAEAANNLGTAQLRLKDQTGAIASLERAIALNPTLIKAHANLAQAYQRASRSNDAARESERVASLTAQLRRRGRAMIGVQSAREQFQFGRKSDAVALLRKIVAESPDFPDAQFELGRMIRDVDANGAIAAFRRVLDLDPERAEAHYQIGLTLEHDGRKSEALSEYQTAVAMTPCDLYANRALANTAMDAGQWLLAAAHFRVTLALEPNDGAAKRQFELASSRGGTKIAP